MNRQVITYTIAFIGLIVVGLFFYIMTGRVERKLAFIVDGMELSGRTELTIGKNSDVCFNRIPHDFITVKREGDSFTWKVNDDYRDSLQYFKINNNNPNKHSIRNDRQQNISFTFPPYTAGTKDTLHLTLTGEEVWNLWEKFPKQVDILSRWFSIKYILEKQDCSSADSLMWLAHLQNGAVRSFFHKKDNQLDIVILDRYTSVDDTIRYVREGHTSALADTARHCKLQFFGISDYCYRCEEPDDDYFQIDGVNYVMKPYVKTTEWGSGHTMVTYTGAGLKVSFPRPVTFVVTVDSLAALSKYSSGIITIKQDNDAIPAKGDMYLPKFSNAINFDLCNIEFFHKEDSITLRDNNYQVSYIEESKSLVPAFTRFILRSGDDKLSVRTGYINRSFVISYMWLPLIVFVVLLSLIWLPISPFKLRYAPDLICNKDRIQNYPIYLSSLLFVCLAYCCCKSLIALKLSYTFPFFEKLTGIIPMSTAMMMMIFFSLTMILNTPLLHISKAWCRWSTWCVCLGLFMFLGYCFFGVMDSQISSGVIQSYLPSEIFPNKILAWMESSAVLDTHRSVVYALFAVEFALLFIWFIMNFLGGWISKTATRCYPKKHGWQITLFVMRQVVCIALILLVGIIGGNFGTAIITLLVVLGLCDALSHIANRLNKGGNIRIYFVLLDMFCMTLLYIGVAFCSDYGYMTNYMGFLLFLGFVFFGVERPDTTFDSQAHKALLSEKKWVYVSFGIMVTIAIGVLFFCKWYFDKEEVNYARYARRVMLFTDFDKLQERGYRYHESDAEFMVIMSHYMQNNDGHDPLSNDRHALHASISSGQSPVVLNDLSVPVAFIGAYGWMASVVFFGLLAILAWLVMRYNIDNAEEYNPNLTTAMQWGVLAMLMWVSTSLYIYLSYHSWLPFTGRLNPGYGVDAVGEALETAILLAFMASVTYRKNID